ncbi:MAG: hypothetical protein NTV49_07070 [Kiritimatiellaeota bacterium]|nr:hypothetical protein [Kiritimatiellota bacterium]
MQAVLTVREEKARFERSGEIPDGALAAGLPALRKLQEAWRAQTAAVPREQAQKIVAVSQRYLQSLANLQKALAARNDAGGVAGVQAEKERLLGNNVVREALAALPPANPVPPPPAPLVPPVRAPPTVEKLGDYTFYPPGREPAAKELRVLRLEFPSADRRAAQFFYELQAAVYSHKRDLYDRDSRTTYSITTTIPRITLSVKNRAVGEGSQLVVEYYSRRVARMNSLRHEKSEVIPLPAMARGWILTVEGEGVRLTNEKLMIAPREFYGLIVSLFDAGGALLFQQCTSTALAPNCRATLPEAAAPAGAADELTPGRKAPP